MTTQEWDEAAESALERGDREELERLFMEACNRIGGDLPDASDDELLTILRGGVS